MKVIGKKGVILRIDARDTLLIFDNPIEYDGAPYIRKGSTTKEMQQKDLQRGYKRWLARKDKKKWLKTKEKRMSSKGKTILAYLYEKDPSPVSARKLKKERHF